MPLRSLVMLAALAILQLGACSTANRQSTAIDQLERRHEETTRMLGGGGGGSSM